MPEEKPITYGEQWMNEWFIWCPECGETLIRKGDDEGLPEECTRCDWRPADHADEPCAPGDREELVLLD